MNPKPCLANSTRKKRIPSNFATSKVQLKNELRMNYSFS